MKRNVCSIAMLLLLMTTAGCVKDNFECTADTQCSLGGRCVNSVCTRPDSVCAAGFRYVAFSGAKSGQCVAELADGGTDLAANDMASTCGATNDPLNCGGCGIACGPTQACVNSACVCAAAAPNACTQNGATTCTNFATDNQNCGSCGNACRSDQLCQSGACVQNCSASYTNCGSYCGNTAEDVNNCGGCGAQCSTNRVAAVCTAGACTGACTTGYADCNSDKLTDGCEINTVNDVNHCGGCAIDCTTQITNATGASCAASACSYAACTTGYGSCDHDPTNGCETKLTRQFVMPAQYATGNGATATATGDFNGDGRVDLAVANGSAFTLSILLGANGGGFLSQTTYATGASPNNVIAIDLNGDHKLDLAVTNSTDATISIFIGHGDGTFAAQQTYAIGASPRGFVSGDFNHDHVLDLATGNLGASSTANNVTIIYGNGDGTFSAPTTFPATSGASALATSDFNGDGDLDLATASYYGLNGYVTVFLSDGTGHFAAPVVYGVGYTPSSLAAGDFTGDMKTDIVIESGNSNGGTIMVNNGDGTFQVRTGILSAAGSATAADLDGDGVLDVVTPGYDSLSVLHGNGNGTFTLLHSYLIGIQGYIFTLADVDGDSHVDIIAMSGGNTIAVLYGLGAGKFKAPIVYGTDVGVAVGDINNDSKLDFLSCNYGNNVFTIYAGDGAGNFTATGSFSVSFRPGPATLGDLNGDGYLDAIIVNGDRTIATLLGNGDGTFQAVHSSATGVANSSVFNISLDDVNHDGHLDVLYATATHALAMLGNGDGTLQAATQVTLQGYAQGVVSGDLNSDHVPDMIVADQSNGLIEFIGNGDGSFGAPVTLGIGGGTTVLVDFDHDGKLDIVTLGGLGVNVALGKGDGTFGAVNSFATTAYAAELVVTDYDGDGKLDLATGGHCTGACGNADSISVLLGNGDGTFQAGKIVAPNVYSQGLFAGDANRDGKIDLVTAGSTGTSVLFGVDGCP